ncbi:MAG TPA: response regulator [Tepidisphaeraceae bacterium]|jgi:response regulator NasT|nr:response regulator [Tepidisphaeraceae bacterium]
MDAPQSATPRRRVLIVEDDTLVGLGVRDQVEKLGHEVIGQASTAAGAEKFYRENRPDVVLMDIRLDGADGISLATELLKVRRCPMVILSAFGDKELIDRATSAGVFGYLIKPVSIESLSAQIEVAIKRFDEHESLIVEKEKLTQLLETRKLVEKAKGIFMKHFKLDEAEAHKRLQQESQKRRISLPDLAKKIIESEDILGGG